MPVREVLDGDHVPVRIWTDTIDAAARQQLVNLARLPCVHHHVAAMPDVHVGIGATIGSVIATRQAIIPAAVGVDIGCGMIACRLSLQAGQLDERALQRVFDQITRDVPVGRAQHADAAAPTAAARPFASRLDALARRHPRAMQGLGTHRHWVNQLGTLGGGNHFIEVCVDETDAVWIMLHSGSRGIGNALARYFIALARDDMARRDVHLPDRDLAYFSEGSAHFADYVAAVTWAQDYAQVNRACLLALVQAALARHLPPFRVTGEVIDCHHNYVAAERHFGADVWVTRKGAIRAGAGDLGIVPGSMGARSYLVRGKGNADSFASCAHGAGRRLSRTAAARRYGGDDLAQQTAGVICRKDRGVVDEIPAAYKDIDAVMAHQEDLVEVVHTLRQLVCVKG